MRRSLSAEEQHELGRQLYRKGHYEQALVQFSQAVAKGDDVNAEVLDNRAATLEKLGRLEDALKDGRRMIKFDGSDVRGYLRVGRILQKMGDASRLETALGIYKLGLRSVPTSDKHHKTLAAVHAKLAKQLAPAVNYDPLAWLPNELIEMILSYLEFHEMLKCFRLSASWRHYLKGRTGAWQHLDLSLAKRRVPRKSMMRYLTLGKGSIKRATFHRHSEAESLSALVRTNRNLEELKFMTTDFGPGTLTSVFESTSKLFGQPDCNWLKRIHMSRNTPVTLDGVTQIMRYCSGLSDARFDAVDFPHHVRNQQSYRAKWTGQWPNLQELRLHRSRVGEKHVDQHIWGFDDLLPAAPYLKRLEIIDDYGPVKLNQPSGLQGLVSLNVWGNVILPRELPSSLEVVRIHAIRRTTPMYPYTSILDPPNITTVEVGADFVGVLNREILGRQLIGQVNTTLQRLTLDLSLTQSDPDYELIDVMRALPYFKALKELGISSCNFPDELAQKLPSLLPQLEWVDLSATKITGVAIKALVLGCSNLKHIGATRCENVDSDAIEWARSKGITVRWFPASVLITKAHRDSRWGHW